MTAPADSRELSSTARSVATHLQRRTVRADVTTPLLAIWGTGRHRLSLYRPIESEAIEGVRLASWIRRQRWEPASPRIESALVRLVRAR